MDAAAQHGQTLDLAAEPEPLVEADGGGVAFLGVHQRFVRTPPTQPAQAVVHERLAEALSLRAGVHGEALEVAPWPGAARDGVADDGVVLVDRHSEPGRGGGVEGVEQPGFVELPELGEGGGIGEEDGGPLGLPPPAQVGGVLGQARGAHEGAAQQVEALVHLEAAGEVRTLVGLGEGGGERAAVAVAGQLREGLVDGGGGGPPSARGEVGHGGVAAPWGDAQAPLGTRQRAVAAHALHGSGGRYRGQSVAVLFLTHERYLDHDLGRGHPERPQRLQAVLDGAAAAGLADALVPLAPEPASIADLERVHTPELVASIAALSEQGGGWVDADTAANEASYDAARLAAGAGLTAVAALDAGQADSAFCAVRPPGHHATPTRAMGFCLFNNVAVTAAALAERGERVLVVDYDAHHGNGTQDIFWRDPQVAYLSFHQYPLYPGTGGLREVGMGAGRGTTVNLPLPAGATGDAFRAGFDEVVAPFAAEFEPTWLLVSAGFDAHRADPITDLGLSAGDYADLTADLLALVPAGRRLVFLEGGYDLEALTSSSEACLAAMAGERLHPEPPTSGGPGRESVAAAALMRNELSDFG